MPSKPQTAHGDGALKALVDVAAGSAGTGLIGSGKAQFGAVAMKPHVERLIVGIAENSCGCVAVLGVRQVDVPVIFGRTALREQLRDHGPREVARAVPIERPASLDVLG